MHLEFNSLPHAVRERFVRVTKHGDPSLVRAQKDHYVVTFVLFTIFFLVALGGLVTTIVGSRDWTNTIPRELYWMMIPAIAVALALALEFLADLIWPRPPYPEGDYLFANYLVSTYRNKFRIHSIAEITRVIHRVVRRRNGSTSLESHYLTFFVGNDMYSFRVDNQAESDAVRQRWDYARAQFAQAWATGDRATLAALDPFHECTMSGQWSWPPDPNGPRCSRRMRGWGAIHALVSIVVALVVPFALFQYDFHRLRPQTKYIQMPAPAPVRTASTVASAYRGKAGSDAAASFIAATLDYNEKADPVRNTLPVSIYLPDTEKWKEIDKEIERRPGSRGKYIPSFALGWSFYSDDSAVRSELDKVLEEALGKGVLQTGTLGFGDKEKNCPTLIVRSEPRAGATLYHVRDQYYDGLFGVRFVVTTRLPDQAELPAFELDVPAPKEAELRAFNGGPQGSSDIHKHNARFVYSKLSARLRQYFLR